MAPIYDLHSHSTFSDGALSPTELVHRAANQGVDYLALTDHDTLAGLPQARAAARAAGVSLVPGVELSVLWGSRELHLLGLWVDADAPELQALVAEQMAARERRARAMGERLDQAAGLSDSYAQACQLAGTGAPGRPFFARLLLDAGKVRNFQHAFDRFLKQGRSAFVKTPWCELDEAVRVIEAAGGLAVLAHPARYGLTRRKLRQLLTDLVSAGGHGLEVVSPGLSHDQRALLSECAREFPLAASAGSDFHSPDQHWLELGWLPGLPTGARPVWEHAAAA
jgi:predicted metal-dependent phosphoesterase TrpH